MTDVNLPGSGTAARMRAATSGRRAIIRRKLRTLTRLPPPILLWMLPVWIMLGLARMLILSISFRRIAPHLGEQCGVAAFLPLINSAQMARARMIGTTIRIAARYTPWQSNCFPQAIVAQTLLRGFGIPHSLFFGVAKVPKDGQLTAHAWVGSDRVAVTGGYSFDRFTVVGVFAGSAPMSV